MNRTSASPLRRRMLLKGMAGTATCILVPGALGDTLAASGRALEAVYREHFGTRRPRPGGVEIDVSRLVENGNSVAVTVRATPAETPPDALYLFMPRNPEPWGTKVSLTPPALPEFATRIRLSGTQNLTAVAEWADGRLGAASVAVMVTLGACADELYGEFGS